MARTPPLVRPARASDLNSVAKLWEELRDSGARWGPYAPPSTLDGLHERLSRIADSPGHELLVAEIDDEPVGVAVLSTLPMNPLTDERTLQISFMHVRDDSRRRGIGRALVTAAAQQAQEARLEYVSVAVYPHARESNRFFARLGFRQFSVRRAVPLATLQRKLGSQSDARRHLLVSRRARSRTAGTQ
ncbi:MAG: GNAT family N-acetyltransferase [Actinomycetes bacterium]